jgi:2-(1,2-epoxy-1,2-dihydrophenyl)acetyl-CoA isomerase
MEIDSFKNIRYRADAQGIVTVTIDRPEIKNALTLGVLLELYRAADAFERDPAALALILTGAPPKPKANEAADPGGEAFSSGGYFNPAEIEAMSAAERAEIDFEDIAQKKLCLKLWGIDKPVIAAINGLAIGGGFTIPAACADLIYLSEHAWARFPFVRLGIAPELASSYLLPRLIGMQKAKEIFFFGEKLTASELVALGLANKVLPHAELLPYARQMALKLVPPSGPPLAVRLTKRILHRPLVQAVTEALDRENEALKAAFGTADFFEAVRARLERREPVFTGS